MKISTISTLLSTFMVFLFISTGCSDNEPLPPITLDVENNSVALLYPSTSNYSIHITGGDGNYSVTSSNAFVLKVEVSEDLRGIDLETQSIGNSTVTITDSSDNSYILNATVAYSETRFFIKKQDVVVIGDKISPAQKREIEQKAMLTLPVKENGKYILIHSNEQDPNKGQVSIYVNEYDEQAVKTTFEIKRDDKDEATGRYMSYIFVIEGKQRKFGLHIHMDSSTKGDWQPPMSLNEDLTDQFKADYPDVELVYTQQLFQN